jgi:peroxiredoxin
LERTEILALSIDDREHQQMMIDRVAEDDGRTIEFRLISDPDHAVIDRYGLLNQEDPRQRPIPHPTVLVIDREGVVRWKFIEINYKIRPTNEDILGALADVLRTG